MIRLSQAILMGETHWVEPFSSAKTAALPALLFKIVSLKTVRLSGSMVQME
jgi:hypothetical protein